MGREKRKTRLDKSLGTKSAEFIGFSAFAESSPNDASTTANDATTPTWSPVYTGKDETLLQLFPRISQKRDATTKVKALQDLSNFLSKSSLETDDRALRRVQVEALQHWAWLYYNKLHYDPSSAVRAESLLVWSKTIQRIPKAVHNLVNIEPELCGMFGVATADPAAEVRAAAQPLSSHDWPWQQGLVGGYAPRILSYGRATVMYDALFGKKSETHTDWTEEQRDAAEERFERIVGTCLDAVSVWLHQQQESEDEQSNNKHPIVDTTQSYWWKTIASPKVALRQKTYRLLAAVCSHEQLSLPENMTNTLMQALSSEKQVMNLPPLLETIVAYLAYQQKQTSDSNVDGFVKPLQKVLKKACLGAHVQLWGPTLLPLTALLEGHELVLLQAAWDGRNLTLGENDRFQLATAVAECTSFVLLRRRSEETQKVESLAREMATLWLEALQYALSSSSTARNSGASAVAAASRKNLLQQLARDLVQFQEAAIDRPNCAFYNIADWFWDQGLDLSQAEPAALAELLQLLQKQDNSIPRLVPHLRARFLSLLDQYHTSSGAIPSNDEYSLLLSVLEFCGPQSVLTQSLEKFIMNELLRWAIVHTSELSTLAQSEWLVKQDFELLYCCLAAIPSKRPFLWESFLHEILTAQCDLFWFVAGLQVLAKSNEDVSWLCCDTLKTFAIKTAAMDPVSSDTPDDAEDLSVEMADTNYEKRLSFFRFCTGLTPDFPFVLVDRGVLEKWIDRACQDTQMLDPLLEVLLELVTSDQTDLTDEEAQRIALHSWSLGGRLYEQYVPAFLSRRSLVTDSFLSSASLILKQQVQELLLVPDNDVGTAVEAWSDRAIRFLEICKESRASSTFARPTLHSLGLLDYAIWESRPDLMYQCTMALLLSIDSVEERLTLIQQSDDASLDMAKILTSVTQGNPIMHLDERPSNNRERSERLLLALGGRGLDPDYIEPIIAIILGNIRDRLADGIKSFADKERLGKEIAVLAQLFELMFLPVFPTQAPDLKPEDVEEGASVWYITDAEKPESREQAVVVKVHYDAHAGYYFTIRLQREDDKEQERQTVLERLRKERFSMVQNGIPEDQIPEREQMKRKHYRELVMNDIVRPFLRPKEVSETTALIGDLVGEIGGVIGLGKERGVGSMHYEVFQLLASLDSELQEAFLANDTETAVHLLWTISLALGCSVNSESRIWSSHWIRFDVWKSCETILEYYATAELGNLHELDRATVAWITSSLEHFLIDAPQQEDDENVKTACRIMVLLFRLATYILSRNEKGDFNYDASIACRALCEATLLLDDFLSRLKLTDKEEWVTEITKVQADALFSLIKTFASSEDESKAVGTPFWAVSKIFALAQTMSSVRDKLMNACWSSNAGGISKALFSPTKRSLAFRLLDLVAEKKAPIQPSSGDVSIGEITKANLTSWLEGLDEDEAAQIEEDVYIVAEWVPLPMMEQVESWLHMDYDSLDESLSIGELLTWLSFLRFVDVAAPNDFRNRPAFISYLTKCGAVNHILNLALLNDATINSGKRSAAPSFLLLEDLLADENDFTLADTASVALFRSVEVLPSLSRCWWEDECPKIYTNTVQMFIEKFVAPRILKRELERIKSSNHVFGAMSVSGSSVSREITAHYVQDEFTLTVLISLPPAFPLRSAEVDCSRTLGIPPNRLKRWSLQIMLMLNNQGGTLKDALMLWKDNVDKEFEGVEPCPVCYSVLHVKTHKLPSLECKTCKNRFHVDCLTQWFRSSGKSQCVLCQQPWQGSRIM